MTRPNDNAELTEGDLRDYFAAFNANDFEGFSQYYADNLVFEGRGRHFRNRDEMVGFYRKLKSRVRETVTLKEVAVGANEMVVEIETELVAFEDWPDMPTGAMFKGQRIRSNNFVWYEIENNRFVHLRSATYRRLDESEPSATVKPFDPSLQSLPPSMSRGRFADFIGALNSGDYPVFEASCNDDVTLSVLGKKELRGPRTVFDLLKGDKARAEQTIRINRVITVGDLLVAELQTEFAAIDDVADSIAGPIEKGQKVSIINFLFHDLRDGKLSRIRSAEFRKTVER